MWEVVYGIVLFLFCLLVCIGSDGIDEFGVRGRFCVGGK